MLKVLKIHLTEVGGGSPINLRSLNSICPFIHLKFEAAEY